MRTGSHEVLWGKSNLHVPFVIAEDYDRCDPKADERQVGHVKARTNQIDDDYSNGSPRRGRVFQTPNGSPAPALTPATMSRVGTVDERFQSYNIEMLEVTGGNFWKPYGSPSNTGVKPVQPSLNVPEGMNPDIYQYRPPIDLTNLRRRRLAAALGPAYVRVSGTWANTTYFYDANGPAPKAPPKGFNGVLTRQQWKGVIDFANAVNARVVTSFATGVGTRNSAGVWTPREATKVLAYTRSIGGDIAAAEFMNEPTAASMGAHRRVMTPLPMVAIWLSFDPSPRRPLRTW